MAAVVDQLEAKIHFDSINVKGGNGFVLIGTNIILGRRVVVKFYYWGDGVHAEPTMLSNLAHPHVLAVHDAAPIDTDDAYFITPFCENGDLDDVLSAERPGIKRVVDIMLDIASGVSFIHSEGYIHRDLKPSNLFSDADGRFVIGDFGSVVRVGENGYADTGSRHSLLYRTPEEVNSSRAYQRGDIYQLGLVLYQLLGGHLPYNETEWLSEKEKLEYLGLKAPDNQLFATSIIEGKIKNGKLIQLKSLPPWCPAALTSVVRKCCHISRDDRFESVAALIAKLNNLRKSLPDWRLEPDPVLYRAKAKYRVIKKQELYQVEKMVSGAFAWRRERALITDSLAEAVRMAESL
ncbi:serine/threonine protein kinase [Sphingomonas sp. Leaf28]|uniref:serine/threonine protein kinase n=1 Tax=Sphingomonas sp. Leaf28 TaxID=1735695 RepID=UPI00138F86C8|nr:serine/threonine-protein kinase [Sphingomonas sp. Leaf28]